MFPCGQGATVLVQSSVLQTKHDVQTSLKKMTLIPRGQGTQKKDEAMPGTIVGDDPRVSGFVRDRNIR